MIERPEGEIGIRDVTDADLLFVAALLNREIERSPYVYAEIPVSLEERRIWLARHRELSLPVLAAVSAEGSPIGWASLSPYRPSSGYHTTVEASIYVDPASHRRGVATRLLAELETQAVRLGKHVIVASIDSDNAPSIALFARFGYAEVGRLPEVGRKFGTWRTQVLMQRCIAPA